MSSANWRSRLSTPRQREYAVREYLGIDAPKTSTEYRSAYRYLGLLATGERNPGATYAPLVEALSQQTISFSGYFVISSDSRYRTITVDIDDGPDARALIAEANRLPASRYDESQQLLFAALCDAYWQGRSPADAYYLTGAEMRVD